MLLDAHRKLTAHLRGHEAVGDAVGAEIPVEGVKFQPDLIVNDIHRAAGDQRGVHVHHVRVEAIAGVRGHAARLIEAIVAAVPVAEGDDVAVLQHTALG